MRDVNPCYRVAGFRRKKIFLDFDGTVVEHKYPFIGKDVPDAMRVIRKLCDNGHTIILNTYRADIDQKKFEDAYQYLIDKLIQYPVEKLEKKIYPPDWIQSLISFDEHLFIDDSASNIPLISDSTGFGVMVDWNKVEQQLKEYKLLPNAE